MKRVLRVIDLRDAVAGVGFGLVVAGVWRWIGLEPAMVLAGIVIFLLAVGPLMRR